MLPRARASRALKVVWYISKKAIPKQYRSGILRASESVCWNASMASVAFPCCNTRSPSSRNLSAFVWGFIKSNKIKCAEPVDSQWSSHFSSNQYHSKYPTVSVLSKLLSLMRLVCISGRHPLNERWHDIVELHLKLDPIHHRYLFRSCAPTSKFKANFNKQGLLQSWHRFFSKSQYKHRYILKVKPQLQLEPMWSWLWLSWCVVKNVMKIWKSPIIKHQIIKLEPNKQLKSN